MSNKASLKNVDYAIVGYFSTVEKTRAAIRTLRKEGHDEDLDVYSPFPEHSIEDEMFRGKPRSPVRFFTLLGGLSGCLGAFLMTCWMSIDYPLRVSAKPLLSIPSFVVIAFECTVLLGGIVTLLAMFHFSRIPNIVRSPGYRRDFSSGTFGLVVRVPKEQAESTKARLEALGAEQVEVEYVR